MLKLLKWLTWADWATVHTIRDVASCYLKNAESKCQAGQCWSPKLWSSHRGHQTLPLPLYIPLWNLVSKSTRTQEKQSGLCLLKENYPKTCRFQNHYTHLKLAAHWCVLWIKGTGIHKAPATEKGWLAVPAILLWQPLLTNFKLETCLSNVPKGSRFPKRG